MNIENENFFDFFGIVEEEIRSLYAQNGKIIDIGDIYIPAPKIEVPVDGIKSIGIKVITADKGYEKIVNIALVIIIIIFIITIIWVIWQSMKSEPIISKEELSDQEDEKLPALL